MKVDVIERETGEVIETITCDWIDGQTAYRHAGRGTSTVTYGDAYELVEVSEDEPGEAEDCV